MQTGTGHHHRTTRASRDTQPISRFMVVMWRQTTHAAQRVTTTSLARHGVGVPYDHFAAWPATYESQTVPGAGIEPAPSEEEGGLSPPCLPISPPGRVMRSGYSRPCDR